MPPPRPDYLSYDQVRQLADEFLRAHSDPELYPVDVEHIVDVVLGIDVVPVPDLLARFEVDGLLAADRSEIWMDDQIYREKYALYRRRFTLAHELGHWYLHRPLFESASFGSLDEWKDFLRSIPEPDYFWYEQQAYWFGGLILVQEEPLSVEFESAVRLAGEKGYELDLESEAHCAYVADHIGRRFDVSRHVIVRRGYYDGLWKLRSF